MPVSHLEKGSCGAIHPIVGVKWANAQAWHRHALGGCWPQLLGSGQGHSPYGHFILLGGSVDSSNSPGLPPTPVFYVAGDFARNWVGTAHPSFLGVISESSFVKDIAHAPTTAFLVIKELFWHPTALLHFPYFSIKTSQVGKSTFTSGQYLSKGTSTHSVHSGS